MLSLDVADTCCCMLQTLNFNVADVEFRYCRHVMLGFVSRRRGRAPVVGCCMQHRWQYSRNMREEGGGPLMFECCTQHAHNVARNMLATLLVRLYDPAADDRAF
jgi:hypothetical protein